MSNVTTLTAIILLFIGSMAYGQQEGKTIFPMASTQNPVLLELDVSEFAIERVAALKDELLRYEEKVWDLNWQVEEGQLSFRYNEKMRHEDLCRAFERQNIPYLKARPSSDQ